MVKINSMHLIRLCVLGDLLCIMWDIQSSENFTRKREIQQLRITNLKYKSATHKITNSNFEQKTKLRGDVLAYAGSRITPYNDKQKKKKKKLFYRDWEVLDQKSWGWMTTC